MKKQMICITGNIAVGKSEVAKVVASTLKWDIYKASQSFREKAREMDMNLVDFCVYVEKHPEIDKEIEETTKNVVQNGNKLVVDARLGFYVAPNAFKVYMTSSIEVAAERLLIASKTRGKEEEYSSIEEVKEAIILREETERNRYIKLYGVDIHDLSNYDFCIDTTNISSLEVAEKIIEAYRKWEGV